MRPTARSTPHSVGLGLVQRAIVGTDVMSAPDRQKAAKISQEPSVLRTSRIVATAAPERIADPMPTICHGPRPTEPSGAIPLMTRPTPTVAPANAPTAADLTRSPRNIAP